MTVASDSHYQYTFDTVYVYEVPWSEFPIVPSYPHYPHRCTCCPDAYMLVTVEPHALGFLYFIKHCFKRY
jgi:hypothetical protein